MENSNQKNKMHELLQNLPEYKHLEQEISEKLINVLNNLGQKGYTITLSKNKFGNQCLKISSKKKGESVYLLISKHRDRGMHFLSFRKENSKLQRLALKRISCDHIVDNITNYIEDTKQKSSIKEFDIKEIDNLRNELDFYKKMRDDKVNGPKAIELVNQVFQALSNKGYKIEYSKKNDNIVTMIISKKDISFSSYILETYKKIFKLFIRSNKKNYSKRCLALNLIEKNFETKKNTFIDKLNELIVENSKKNNVQDQEKESKVEYQEKKLNNNLNKGFNNTSNNKVSKEELFSENQEKVEIKKENKTAYDKIHESLDALVKFLAVDKIEICKEINHNLSQERNYNPGDVIEINFKFKGFDCMISFELMDKYKNDDRPMAMVQYLTAKDMNPDDLRKLIKNFQEAHNKTNVLSFGYRVVRRIQKEQKTIKKETFSEFGESDCEGEKLHKKQCTEEKKGTGDRGINLGKQSPTEPIVQEQQFQQK